jgi:hypothetical protein
MNLTNLTWIADPSHAWLKVPLNQLGDRKYSNFSYKDEEFAYLEEDCDATLFLMSNKVTMQDAEQIPEEYTDGSSEVRRYRRIND